MAQTPVQFMIGRGSLTRYRRVIRTDNIARISKASLRRLARRGGVLRLSNTVYPVIRGTLYKFLQQIIQTAVIYTSHARRKTVTVYDIIYALKHEGRTLFGFGDMTDLTSKIRRKKPLRSKRNRLRSNLPVVDTETQCQVTEPVVQEGDIPVVQEGDIDSCKSLESEPEEPEEVKKFEETEEKSSEKWLDVRDISFRGKKTPPPNTKKRLKK